MALPTPSNPVNDINQKIASLRAKYGYDKGQAIDKVISQARSDGLPDADLNILLVDNKNLQEAKSQGHLGGIAKTLHTALNIASPVMGQVLDAPRRAGQVVDAAVQNLQGAGQQIKTGAQNIGQAFTSPDTYVNENGISVPSVGKRDVMNRVSQAGMGILDVASGAGQAALTPYVAPMGAVKDELGQAAHGYSEAWKLIPDNVKKTLGKIPVNPMVPQLTWGHAIEQIKTLPKDQQEAIMEAITAVSGAATVGTTIQGAKDAFNAADQALNPNNYSANNISSIAKNSIQNNPTGLKADRLSGKGYSYDEMINGPDNGRIVIGLDDNGNLIIKDGRHLLEAYNRASGNLVDESMNRIPYNGIPKDIIKFEDGATSSMIGNPGPLSQGVDNVKGAVKSVMGDTSGKAMMPTAGLGGELKLPKRLQSLTTGDVVNIKGELATVTGSNPNGLDVEFWSDGSKDTVVKFDKVMKATQSEISKAAQGIKMPDLKSPKS